MLTPNSDDDQALVQGPGGPCAPVKPTTLHARSLREHGDLHEAISARTIPGFPSRSLPMSPLLQHVGQRLCLTLGGRIPPYPFMGSLQKDNLM